MQARTRRTVRIIADLRYTDDLLHVIAKRHGCSTQNVHGILQTLRREGCGPAHRKPQPWKNPTRKVTQ